MFTVCVPQWDIPGGFPGGTQGFTCRGPQVWSPGVGHQWWYPSGSLPLPCPVGVLREGQPRGRQGIP